LSPILALILGATITAGTAVTAYLWGHTQGFQEGYDLAFQHLRNSTRQWDRYVAGIGYDITDSAQTSPGIQHGKYGHICDHDCTAWRGGRNGH